MTFWKLFDYYSLGGVLSGTDLSPLAQNFSQSIHAVKVCTSGLHKLTSFTWNLLALQFYHNTSFHSFIRHQNLTFIYTIFLSHCENNIFLLSGCVTFGMWSHLWAMKNKLTLVWEEKTERKTILIRSQKTSVCSDTIRNASHTCTGFYARLYKTQASLKSKSTFVLFMLSFQITKKVRHCHESSQNTIGHFKHTILTNQSSHLRTNCKK